MGKRRHRRRAGGGTGAESGPLPSPTHDVPAGAMIPPPGQPQFVSASTVELGMPPNRPSLGTFGKKVKVKANHFKVTVSDGDIIHYEVSISPKVYSRTVCRDIMNRLRTRYASQLGGQWITSDGRKSCYTARELPFSSKDFIVELFDQDRKDRETFTVSIKVASSLPKLSENGIPQKTLQALDVVLREKPSMSHDVVGRSFFDLNLSEREELGNGLQGRKGFYQSLRPTQMGLSLNIDVSAAAFFEPILVSDYIGKLCSITDRNWPLPDLDRIKVERALHGVMVKTTHRSGRFRRISGLSTLPINDLMFTDACGMEMSVCGYFESKYSDELIKYPSLPAVQAGSDVKPIYLPMELCNIVNGQRCLEKLDESQVRRLLKITSKSPKKREKDIERVVRGYYYGCIANSNFGIEVSPELTSIEARILPAPSLHYSKQGLEHVIQPIDGKWNMDDKEMVKGGRVDDWACINFSQSNIDDVEGFCEELISVCCSKGMVFKRSPLLPTRSADAGQIEKSLRDIHIECSKKLEKKGLDLLIIILPDFNGAYGRIKRMCDIELGIVSQCCQPSKALQCQKQYLVNMALKINVKVGGRNTILEPALLPHLTNHNHPTIIIGADVSHPHPGDDSSPSIAAVVASMDWPEVSTYKGVVSAQTPRKEIIQDLYNEKEGGMIKELLLAFIDSMKVRPGSIIFYRDGVSESHYKQILQHEMMAVKDACASIQTDYRPKVTFVVVQKRHHTRLFHGAGGNVSAGTVVDDLICRPHGFDFYLCSHACSKGTSRPTHYHVLHDENNFSANHLQFLTYSLCYTYARRTRSVSIVPPVYYAHLAAYRARFYVEGADISDSGLVAGGAGETSRSRSREVRPLPPVHDNVKKVMFYC